MYRKCSLLLFILLLITPFVSAQFGQLSDDAEISVVTPEPGQEAIFTIYGHIAIRVYDPVNHLDLAFDYGIFDFDDPNFALNFTKGYLKYSVGVREFRRFTYAYEYYNRTIHEQLLDLNQEEKQEIYEFLANNALPENKYYFYDYFYDNCATRIRDVLSTVLGDKLKIDENYVNPQHSFREMVDSLSVYQPWGELGIDICLGLPMDKKMTSWDYMFLPGYVYKALESATISRNGKRIPLVKQSRILFEAAPQQNSAGFLTPRVVFWTLFFLILLATLLGIIKGKQKYWIDISLFSITGLLGVLLLFLWVFTDHKAASNNLNVLWAMPLNFIMGILLIPKIKPNWLGYYFLGFGIFMMLLMLGWPFIPQGYNPSFLPIVASLFIRAVYTYWRIINRQNIAY